MVCLEEEHEPSLDMVSQMATFIVALHSLFLKKKKITVFGSTGQLTCFTEKSIICRLVCTSLCLLGVVLVIHMFKVQEHFDCCNAFLNVETSVLSSLDGQVWWHVKILALEKLFFFPGLVKDCCVTAFMTFVKQWGGVEVSRAGIAARSHS